MEANCLQPNGDAQRSSQLRYSKPPILQIPWIRVPQAEATGQKPSSGRCFTWPSGPRCLGGIMSPSLQSLSPAGPSCRSILLPLLIILGKISTPWMKLTELQHQQMTPTPACRLVTGNHECGAGPTDHADRMYGIQYHLPSTAAPHMFDCLTAESIALTVQLILPNCLRAAN